MRLVIIVWQCSSEKAHYRLQGVGWNILEWLTWVDTTRAFVLQVTQHLCTQLCFFFWLAKDLWVGDGTVWAQESVELTMHWSLVNEQGDQCQAVNIKTLKDSRVQFLSLSPSCVGPLGDDGQFECSIGCLQRSSLVTGAQAGRLQACCALPDTTASSLACVSTWCPLSGNLVSSVLKHCKGR